MNNFWPTKKLGEICEIRTGKKDVDEGNPNGKYPFFSCSREINYSDAYSFDTEAILIAGNGDVGNTKIYKGKFEAYQRTYVLDKFQEDIKYIYYYLLGNLKGILVRSKSGSTMHYIRKGDLENFNILVPESKNIQQKIVYVLDSIQTAVGAQEKIIEKTKEFRRAIMAKLFREGIRGEKLKKIEIGEIPKSWEVVKIKDVILETLQNDPFKKPFEEIKYIDVSNISNKLLKIVEYRSYLGKEAPSRARKIVKTEDVIFATVRPYLKRIAFISLEYNGFYVSTAFCVLRSNNKIIFPSFLFYFVSRDVFVSKVCKHQTGTGYPAITDDNIKNELISLPSLSEQQEIAGIFQTIDQKIEIEQKKKALYEELFRAMLNKIMSGEIKISKI